MPAPESSSTGPSAAPNACSSSRKEKKKQAKEERDRLKQVEKKKRRLEKALATAAAIRIELEKKKQKRKEEEQRLDEEGAALAEAVALQVLVDEDVDILEESTSTNNVVVEEKEETSQLSLEDYVEKAGNPQISSGQSLDIKREIYYTYIAAVSTAEDKIDSTGNSDWEVSMNHTSRHATRDKFGKFEALQVERVVVSDEEIFSNLEDNLKASNERAKAAEVTAGMAAAQAVAALRIAEEARAEAEAAKKAAEAAINQFLDRKQLSHVDEGVLQINYQPKNIEMERDELKARLEETEHQLKEKTRQVVCLEQSLEDMTQYLLQLNTKLPFVTGGGERECLTLERDCTSVTESSGGTVDQ